MKGLNSPEGSPRDDKVEWKTTPIYKQFALKVTEVDSLMEKAAILNSNEKGFNWNNIDRAMLKKLVESALQNMLHSGEIDYNLSLLKSTELDKEDLEEMYKKSILTLKILMIKLGIENTFQKVKDHYD